ncbi:hypothetical protein [Hoyosella subflava]|uniref:ABC-2 type transport system permease protein n=1 Tax=Hoyosella subflava (strain DSM 45089 / JCM 17490 / NBRC 109087 / DQS3-9A1) TaxID=443218 RepID=F6EEW4_HOYSD|nr:hypothetical protein [Hoyosella subflava]AEF42101.1 hypothetical protein AS9A_3663 [Hoyosella subflava DQS3-9A1]
MVALLMRLRWAITRNNHTGGRLALYILLGVLGLLAGIGSLLVGLAQFDRPGAEADLIALVAATWGVVWIFTPFVAGTVGGALRPTQFALLPLPPRQFAVAFLLTSFATAPVAFTLLGLGGPVLYALRTAPEAVFVAVPAVVLQTIFVVGLARLVGIWLTALASTRKGRDLAMLAAVVLGAGLWLVYMAMQLIVPAVINADAPWLNTLLRAVPFGWAAHATDLAIAGSWISALGMLLALASLIAVISWAWTPVVTRQMLWPGGESGAAEKSRRTSSRAQGPLSASVGKEFALLWRDPRRKAALLVVPMFLALVFVGPSIMEGFDAYLAGALVIMTIALLSGFLNLYGFDGPAVWQVLVTPDGARHDLRGKQFAWVTLAAPILMLVLVGRYVLYDRGLDALAYDLSSYFAALGVGAAAVGLSSVLAPYPVPSAKQGNPFSTRGSFNSASLASLFLTIAALAAVFTVFALLTASGGWIAWLAVPVGAGVGYGAWILGGRISSRALESRGPEILAVVRKEP